MRAHGTQKIKTEAMCSHKTKTQAHGQQNKSPAMCKTGHKHAANEKTHKPRSHKTWQHESTQPMKYSSCKCHTAQDITWMHTADKNTNCVQHHKTRGQESATAGRIRDRRLTQRDRTWRARPRVFEPRYETETQNTSAGIRTPRSNTKQGTQTRDTLKATRLHKNRRIQLLTRRVLIVTWFKLLLHLKG